MGGQGGLRWPGVDALGFILKLYEPPYRCFSREDLWILSKPFM